jgi:hypothetical protein
MAALESSNLLHLFQVMHGCVLLVVLLMCRPCAAH